LAQAIRLNEVHALNAVRILRRTPGPSGAPFRGMYGYEPPQDRRLTVDGALARKKTGPPPNTSAVYVVTFFLGLAAGLLWYRVWEDFAWTGGQTKASCFRGRLFEDDTQLANFTLDLSNFADAAEYHTRLEMTCYFPMTPYPCSGAAALAAGDCNAQADHEAVPLEDRPLMQHRTHIKCNAGVWGDEKCNDLDWECTPGPTIARPCSAWERAIATCADTLDENTGSMLCWVIPSFPSLGIRTAETQMPIVGVTLAALFSIAALATCTRFFCMMGDMRKSETFTWLLMPLGFVFFIIIITWLWDLLVPHPPSITRNVAAARAEVDMQEPPPTFGYGHEALDMGLAVIMLCGAVCLCLCCSPCARTFIPMDDEEEEEDEEIESMFENSS